MSSNFSIKDVSEEMIESLFRFENNSEYRKYLQRINNPKRMIVNSSKNGMDKKITNIYNDKSKEILFENGVKKEIFEDGYTIIYFKNGDIKQKLEDGTTLYYFNDKKVDQITLVNGLNVNFFLFQIYRFDNNQVEIHYDGNKYIEIRNPDGTIKILGSPIH
jgi:centromere protein J